MSRFKMLVSGHLTVSKEAALELIKPQHFHSGKDCLKNEIGIEIMCKEYGDDSDWVGIESDDYENIKEDEHYQTFQIWI